MPIIKKRPRRSSNASAVSSASSEAARSSSSLLSIDPQPKSKLVTPPSLAETTATSAELCSPRRLLFGKYVVTPALPGSKMIDRMYRDHHRHTNRLGDGALDDPMNGEFTQGSMQRLINASMRHQSMNNENNSVPIYFADIGSGSGKVVMHLAACVSNALAIGIEVSRVRFIVSLLCQKEALDRCDEYSTRVLFKYADVLSMDSFGPLTHIYAASAAFPDALMRHLAIMWKASLTAKFLVCNHNPKQMLNVFQFTDLRYVNVKIQCTMHGSGEGKTFYFYERWCGDGQEQRLTGKEEINSTPQSKRVRCISGGTALVTTDELDSLSQGEGRETRLQAIRQTLDEFMNETATKRRRNVMRYTA